MSLQFNGSDTNPGIIQLIENELGFNRGDISGNESKMARFTAYVNLSLDEVDDLKSEFGIYANPDDTNHADYPIFNLNAVATQQDYSAKEDSNGNLITNLTKIQYQGKTLTPVNQQAPDIDVDFFQNGSTGTPTHVDITANSFFVWPTPDKTVTDAFTLFATREGSYFLTTDTTKKPGYSPSHHFFSVIASAEMYARIEGLSNHKDKLAEKLSVKQALRNSIARQARIGGGIRTKQQSTR